MEIETSTGTYIISREPSELSERKSKEDICISRRRINSSKNIATDGDSEIHDLIAIFAQENGDLLVLNEPLPRETSFRFLCQQGFIDELSDAFEINVTDGASLNNT